MSTNAHIELHSASDESSARAVFCCSSLRSITLPTVVSSPNCRLARPKAMAPSTEPPSELSTTVSLVRSLAFANNEIHWQRISRPFCQPVNGFGLLGWDSQGRNPESNTQNRLN